MGCFLGCFGDARDRTNRKQRTHRASPRGRPKQFTNANAHYQILSVADESTQVTQLANLVSEQPNKPREQEQMSPSPKKRVTFNSNVVTHEHVSVFESTDSLLESNGNTQEENPNSISAESYPPNHRYYNARDSDDEAEDYDDSDLDDLDDSDDEQDYYDDYDEEGDCMVDGQEEAWSEGIIISSKESIAENRSGNTITEEVDSSVEKTWLPDEKARTEGFESKTHARERRDYVNSVLNPVENMTQWKSAKSKVTSYALKPQKENITFSTDQTIKIKEKSDEWKNQEVAAVDASLSNWLISPDPSEKTMAEWSNSGRSFEDRPILGALTADELKDHVLATSSPNKLSATRRSPDNMPIIGTVGTYWIHSNAT